MSALSIIDSVDPLLSASHLLRLILLAGLAFYIVDQAQGLCQIALPVAIQVIVQSIIGVSQFLRQSYLGLQAWGEYLLNSQWEGVSIVVSDGE